LRLGGGRGRVVPRVLPLGPHRPAVRGHGLGVRPGLTTATAVLAAPIRRSLPLTEGNQPLTRSDSPVLVPPVPDTRPGSGGRRTLSCHPCRTTGSGTAHGQRAAAPSHPAEAVVRAPARTGCRRTGAGGPAGHRGQRAARRAAQL